MIFFVIVSLIVALLRGGSILRLSQLHIRHAYLILLGLALQLFVFSPLGARWEPWMGYLYLASLVLLLLAVALNRDLPGIRLLGLGLFLNLLVIAANGGLMPISIEAARRAGLFDVVAALQATGRHTNVALMDEGTRLWFLGDTIVLGYPLPSAHVFSPGDILVALGAFVFLQWAMLGPNWLPHYLQEGRPLAYLLSLGRVSWVKGAAIFGLGLLLGWLIIGWVLWPVEYYDTDPPDLRRSHQEAYISLVADSFGLNGDVQLARERLQDFDDEEIGDIILTLLEREGEDLASSQRLRDLAQALALSLAPSGE
ncbi:MAG TPA: hypothetical protein DCP08_06900 [Chloroflexi bacterium]|nr:hypothetical protein [Chloroflexota bacterium]